MEMEMPGARNRKSHGRPCSARLTSRSKHPLLRLHLYTTAPSLAFVLELGGHYGRRRVLFASR